MNEYSLTEDGKRYFKVTWWEGITHVGCRAEIDFCYIYVCTVSLQHGDYTVSWIGWQQACVIDGKIGERF